MFLLIKGLEREVCTTLPHRADGAPVPQAVGGCGVDQEDAAVPSVTRQRFFDCSKLPQLRPFDPG